MFIAIP